MSSLAWPGTATAPNPQRLAEIAAELVKGIWAKADDSKAPATLFNFEKRLRIALLDEAKRLSGTTHDYSAKVMERWRISDDSISYIQRLRKTTAPDRLEKEAARVLFAQGQALTYQAAIFAFKKAMVLAAIEHCRGNHMAAARLLGVSRNVIWTWKRK